MYKSIKRMCTVTLQVHPFIRYDGMTDKILAEAINIPCYPVEEIKTVFNTDGIEIKSVAHFYIDGTTNLHKDDCINFNNKLYDIKHISIFYGYNGPDIKVVYI